VHFDEMPLFFLHIYNDDVTLDEEGIELVDASAAMERARSEARILAAESIKTQGQLVLHHKLEIEDADRRSVGTVHFNDVIEIRP
jgi:hypothetical protein